jgi:hypothetical protein
MKRHTQESDALQERHKRELAELESRWWEEDFIKDPWVAFYTRHPRVETEEWIKGVLPTIIRKREKIGVVLERDTCGRCSATFCGIGESISISLLIVLAGRTLAPGERIEI